MKKWISRLFAAVLSLMLVAALPVLAAPVTLELPVRVELGGKKPAEAESFSILLEAVSKDAPMPAGAEDGKYILKLQGPGTGSFPTLSFSHPMQAAYRVTQIPGTAAHYTYDSTSYEAAVTVAGTPQGLFPEVVLTRAGQAEKAAELVFENRYDPPAKPPAGDNPKMGDEFPLSLWLSLGSAALLGAVILGVLTFRRRKDK